MVKVSFGIQMYEKSCQGLGNGQHKTVLFRRTAGLPRWRGGWESRGLEAVG
jgi:hypothetical protein